MENNYTNTKSRFLLHFLLLVTTFLFYGNSWGQVSYSQDWSATGLNSWITSGFVFGRTTNSVCQTTGSIRGERYSGNSGQFTSPLLGTSNGGEITLNFYYKVTVWNAGTTGTTLANLGTINVQYASSTSGPWTTAYTINSSNHTVSTSCALKTVNFFPPTGNLYIRFNVTSGSGGDNWYYFDDVSVSQSAPPSCSSPTALSSSAITSNSASLSWTPPGSAPADGYDIYYSTSSTAPLVGTSPTVNNHSASPYGATGLSPNNLYYWWVRSDCSGGDTSGWVSGGSFTTLCNAITSLPWTEGFESLSSVSSTTFPSCWLEGTGTNWRSQDASTTSYNDARTGTKYIGCVYGGTNDRIWTPGFQLTAGVSYDFSTYFVGDGYSGWTGDIVYNTGQSATGETVLGSSFIISSTTSTSGTNYAQIKRTFVPVSSGVYYFGIRITSTNTPWSSMSFDDFTLELSPTCVAPVSIAATTAITATTATINWTASPSSPSNGYEWEVRTSGAGGSGATGLATSGSVGAGILTANATGLTAETSYTVYVRANCGGGDFSAWTSGGSFTTLCAAEVAPTAVQDFETYTGVAPAPSCWSEATGALAASTTLSGTTSAWTLRTNGFANITSGNKGVTINLYRTKNDWIISQPIDLGATAGLYRIKYKYAVTSYAVTASQTTLLSHKVDVVISTDGGTTWSNANVLKTYTGAATYSNTGTDEYINLSAYSGVVKIAFVATTTSYSPDIDFHIDDFSVELIPTDAVDWANLQYISLSNAQTCQTIDVYTRAYEGGVTNAVGQGSGIMVWIGKNSSNTDPSTWSESAWTVAPYLGDADGYSVNDNDEYKLSLSGLTVGTHYIASRWQLNGGPYRYGATNDGFWDGSSHNNGVIIVTSPEEISASASELATCSGSSTTLTASSADASYTYEWDNGGGSGASVSVAPTSTTTYTATGTNSAGCIKTSSVTITVSNPPSTVIVATSDATVCSKTVQTLTATGGEVNGTGTIGSGTINPGSTSYPNLFSSFYGGVKHQMIYDASELTAQGVSGTITSISFNLSAFVANDCTNLTIRMKNTSNTILTGFETGTTTVYGGTTFTPSATGWVNFTLSAPFVWDGTSNLLVEVVHNAGNGGYGSGTRTYCSTTTENKTYYGAKDNVAGGISGFDALSSWSTFGANTNRPNIRFDYFSSEIMWSPTTNLYTDAACTVAYDGVSSATTLYAKPLTTTTYTASSISGSCIISDAVTLTTEAVTWDGSWSGTPAANKSIVFDADYTSPGGGTVIEGCDCTVTSGNITIASEDVLVLQNDIAVNSGLITFENNASLIQVNDVSNSGNIVYNRTSPLTVGGSDYVYWSSPVAGQTVPSGQNYIWNNGAGTLGGWASAATSTMGEGQGVIMRGVGSKTFTGIPFNGDVSVDIHRRAVTGLDDNWNLVGNPYPSAINANKFIQDSDNGNIIGTIALWTHGNPMSAGNAQPYYANYTYSYNPADYIYYNTSGTQSGPTGFNGNIAAGQSFFVQMVDGATASSSSIKFKNSMRTDAGAAYDNSQFYRNASTTDEKHRIWLDIVNSSSLSDRIMVGYISNATNENDRLYDAARSTSTTGLRIYSLIGAEKMAIQGRSLPFDTNDIVPLAYNAPTTGNYSIAIHAVDGLFETQDVYLEDTQLNIVHNLKQAPYSFTVATVGENNVRFKIRYTTSTLGDEDFDSTDNVFIATKNALKVFSTAEQIESISVFDLLGRTIYNKNKINANEFTIPVERVNAPLIVKVKLTNGVVVDRKVLF